MKASEAGVSSRELWKGNEAIAEAAIRAGCRCFVGYPITPASEIMEYMAKELPGRGGVFLQAESEVSGINMVLGGAATAFRAMTASSGPGISLMQEAISCAAACELPCVLVNMNRGGPGIGTVYPSQSDYFQAVKGGGNGDYKTVVLAPSGVQEAVDLVEVAFDIADRYRNPVMILADGMIGQMMEGVEMPPPIDVKTLPEKPWAVTGKGNRERNLIVSFAVTGQEMEGRVRSMFEKYRTITKNEARFTSIATGDAEYLLVAYGSAARVATKALRMLRDRGLKVGLLKVVTLWPFPAGAFDGLLDKLNGVFVVEMSMGQLVEDVRLTINGRVPVQFYGRTGGVIPGPNEIAEWLENLVEAPR